MAAIPMIMMVGAAISTVGAMSQAQAAKSASSYDATLRERDARIATDQAGRDAEQVRKAGMRAQGSLLAGYGASGGDG